MRAAAGIGSALGYANWVSVEEFRVLKSFRLYFGRRVVLPDRVVADYQPEELARLRAEFRLLAQHYRRCRCIGAICVAIFMICVLLFMTFPKYEFYYGVCAFTSWLAGILLAIGSPVPNCPACHNALDQGIDTYCPECGAHAIQRDGWFTAPSCLSCRKKLTRRKTRHYTIRACTHCGVMLDDKGI